ncbi:MAG: ThiF family adenylyltransferase [Chloracidobacterium sp.]|nr:ThiF family adenylyltransferase [Chloracidobacterium sp.]
MDNYTEPAKVVPEGAFPVHLQTEPEPIEMVHADRFVPAPPPALGLFARHEGVPAHHQELLGKARVLGVGAGGLNSITLIGMARSGCRTITITDEDRVDQSNLSRQFFFAEDLGKRKGKRLAHHVAAHAIDGADITGIGLPFEAAVEKYPLPADLIIAGVDNNACRLHVVREARKRGIPAIFSMLSLNGMRGHVFLQDASPLAPCLWCALPNLDPERITPCASAVVSSCFMMAAFTIFFAHRALMGWGTMKPFNWREADLSGVAPDRIGNVERRPQCPVCS